MIEIVQAVFPEDAPVVGDLLQEYERDLGVDLCFQGFQAELAALDVVYAPPRGGIWLARDGRTVHGIVCLKPLADPGPDVCELKRLYVRPLSRGGGLGRRLTERCLQAARAAGYRTLRLDSLKRLTAAGALYQDLGFEPIAPYNENPEPDVVYMALDLTGCA